MNGKFIVILIFGTAAIFGATMYYLQVYAFYEELPANAVDLRLTSVATGQPEAIPAIGIQAIDANSSPLRFRACFTTELTREALGEAFVAYENPEPLTGPRWFDCYDAAAVGAALENGEATAYLAQPNIRDGVDRVIAVFDDGRAYAWHQLNEKYQD